MTFICKCGKEIEPSMLSNEENKLFCPFCKKRINWKLESEEERQKAIEELNRKRKEREEEQKELEQKNAKS